jgi:hypothetical protein
MKLITHIKNIQPIHIIGLYVIVYLCLLPFYQYQINPDAVSYIACAKAYANGNFFRAINGYWSPLLCWLLVPFIKAGTEPLVAIKIINLCFSSIALYTLYLVARSYITKPLYIICLLLLSIPHLLIFSLTSSTPDIISLALLLAFTYYGIRMVNTLTVSGIFITGITGALCYFAKYYNFYGVLLLFAVIICYSLFNRKTKTAGYVLAAALVFLLFSGMWMWVIYYKYGVFTPTTASSFNVKLMSQPPPGYPFLLGNGMLPINYDQFYYTSWEDPFYYPSTGWAVYPPNVSKTALLLKHIKTNLHSLLLYYNVELFLGFIAVLIFVVKRKSYNPVLYILFAAAILYPLGYIFTIFEHRYIFFSIALTCFLFFAAIDKVSLLPGKQVTVLLVTVLVMCIPFARRIKMPPANEPYTLFNQSENIPDLKNRKIVSSPGTWGNALYLCYFRNAKLYDTLQPEFLNSESLKIYAALDYYFCLRNEVPAVLSQNPVIYIDRFAIIALHPERNK